MKFNYTKSFKKKLLKKGYSKLEIKRMEKNLSDKIIHYTKIYRKNMKRAKHKRNR